MSYKALIIIDRHFYYCSSFNFYPDLIKYFKLLKLKDC
jgi:hypothetical protein